MVPQRLRFVRVRGTFRRPGMKKAAGKPGRESYFNQSSSTNNE